MERRQIARWPGRELGTAPIPVLAGLRLEQPDGTKVVPYEDVVAVGRAVRPTGGQNGPGHGEAEAAKAERRGLTLANPTGPNPALRLQ